MNVASVVSHLDENAIQEFQKLYKKVSGEDISFEKAKKEATQLISFVYLVAEKNGDKNERNRNKKRISKTSS